MVVGDADLAAVASAIAHGARADMLAALAGGIELSATELARRAGVQPSAATPHLSRLLDARLVECEGRGRHRYYRIANGDVAVALEAMAMIAPPRRAVGLRRVRASEAIAAARTCYDHLAGSLGVALAESLVERGWVKGLEPRRDCVLSPRGRDALEALGVDTDAAMGARRAFARGCLDWTERRPHLAGALGAALLNLFLQRGWVRRRRDDRALTVTREGAAALLDAFGVDTDGVAFFPVS